MASKYPDKSELLFSAKEISLLVDKIADEITAELKKSTSEVVFVGILKGSWMFMADLVRKIDYPMQVDFMRASSYGSAKESSGKVQFEPLSHLDFNGRDVFLVDEIVDTGRTLSELKKHFTGLGARSVRLVALLDKKCRRLVELDADYVGIEIPDVFVVGYGLDWAERYRDLPDIYSIVSEV